MRIFTASLATETNTFAAAPTGLAAYQAFGLFRGADSLRAPEGTAQIPFLQRLCEADGHTLVPGLCAYAEPSGRTVQRVYESLRDALLDELRAAGPVDAVLLFLHGAMAAEAEDDCEGDLLERVRAIVGAGVAVGAELDLHCHCTERMRRAADVIVAYKEYPHTDVPERAAELYRLLLATARREVRPVTAVFDCRMVGVWRTTQEPMRSFVRRLQSFEGRDGILSVSLGHGFPWGDVADGGARLWVVADGDRAKAARLAEQLGREFWALRHAMQTPVLDVETALDRALAIEGGPVVLADQADNPGGGAAGDSTFILEALLARGVGDAALGAFWDLGAIQMCAEAGVGATLDVRVGGKCGPASGRPVDLRATVRAIRDDHVQDVFGAPWPMGRSVWLQTADGIDLVLCSLRQQVYGIDAFTGLGIDLAARRLVVVKSTQHFRAAFEPMARAVLEVDSPGTLRADFAAIDYRVRSPEYWPRVPDPHGWGVGP